MRRYSKYKDSGIEWLGEIPAQWEVCRLKYAASVNDAILPETTPPDYELLYVDIGSVDAGKGIVKRESMVFDEAPSRARRTVKDGDVIVSTVRTYLRAIAAIKQPEPNLVVSTGFAVVRPNGTLESGFASYALDSPYFVEKVVAESVGVSYPAINPSELACLSLVLPPAEEQRAIAEFLDRETGRIDGLIEKKQRQIEFLQEKRTALISHAVTKGLDPNAKMKPSGIDWLGEIPEGWVVTKLLFVTESIGDGLHGTPEYLDSSGLYFVNGNNLVDEEIRFFDSTREVAPEAYQANKLPLGKNSVLLSINGTIGNVGVYRGEEIMLGKSAAYINCGPKLNRLFLAKQLQSDFVRCYIDLELTGTTIKNLSLASIRQMPIAQPPLSEQSEICKTIEEQTEKVDSLITTVRDGIAVLHEYRTALISAAVTGKIDVREEATRVGS